MDYSRLSLIVIRIPVHPWITSHWVIHDVANSYRFKRLLKWLDVRKKIKLLVSVSRSIHLQSVLVARLKAEDEFSSIFLQYIPVAHEKSRNEFWLLLNEREEEKRRRWKTTAPRECFQEKLCLVIAVVGDEIKRSEPACLSGWRGARHVYER